MQEKVTIIGEGGKVYEGIYKDSFVTVNTSNRKAFVMKRHYEVFDGLDTIEVICTKTHQMEGKFGFGGFGFSEVL